MKLCLRTLLLIIACFGLEVLLLIWMTAEAEKRHVYKRT